MRRARPVAALASVAFAIGAIVGAQHGGSAASTLASRFVSAWTRGDYATMYTDIDPASRHGMTASEFAAVYGQAMRTATAMNLEVTGKPRDGPGGLVSVPVRVRTRLFGTLALDAQLRIEAAPKEAPRSPGRHRLRFPECVPVRRSADRQRFPGGRRCSLGTVPCSPKARRAARAAHLTAGRRSASAVVGEVGPIPSARRPALEAQGVPSDAIVGVSGLERALDERLRGTPGGELLAGRRVLATAGSHAASAVRTTVSPAVQRAAVTALGGQLGGIVAMAPSSGQILAVAGIGLDSLQPPGSTFKMITLTGVLEAGIANPHSVFPYATYATLDGVKLHNANGEECGGSLELAFAVSCNSVFAPLGVKLGAPRLVATAERFGFNHDPGIEGAAESSLPAASAIQGELDVGSTAIGQGQVQASALEMAIVAASIADGGRRPQPAFTPGPPGTGTQATSAAVARTVRRLMIGVVRNGTGTAAAIPGVVVAGKTGTAELKTKSSCPPSSETSSARTGSGWI